MATSKKTNKKKKGCKTVKGGACLCNGKFAKKARCGKTSKKTTKKATTKKRPGCYAKTRDACFDKVQKYKRTKRAMKKSRAKKAYQIMNPESTYDMPLQGLRRRRRRSR